MSEFVKMTRSITTTIGSVFPLVVYAGLGLLAYKAFQKGMGLFKEGAGAVAETVGLTDWTTPTVAGVEVSDILFPDVSEYEAKLREWFDKLFTTGGLPEGYEPRTLEKIKEQFGEEEPFQLDYTAPSEWWLTNPETAGHFTQDAQRIVDQFNEPDVSIYPTTMVSTGAILESISGGTSGSDSTGDSSGESNTGDTGGGGGYDYSSIGGGSWSGTGGYF